MWFYLLLGGSSLYLLPSLLVSTPLTSYSTAFSTSNISKIPSTLASVFEKNHVWGGCPEHVFLRQNIYLLEVYIDL